MLKGWISNNHDANICVHATGYGQVYITLKLNDEDNTEITALFEKQTVETIIALMNLAKDYKKGVQ
jgi:acylphosphatase